MLGLHIVSNGLRTKYQAIGFWVEEGRAIRDAQGVLSNTRPNDDYCPMNKSGASTPILSERKVPAEPCDRTGESCREEGRRFVCCRIPGLLNRYNGLVYGALCMEPAHGAKRTFGPAFHGNPKVEGHG